MRACILVDVDDGTELDVLKHVRGLPAKEKLNVGFPAEEEDVVLLNGRFADEAEIGAFVDELGDRPDVLGTTVYREKEGGV